MLISAEHEIFSANKYENAKMAFSYLLAITKTRLFKYIENFTTKKIENFQIKILIFFFYISAQNID